MYNDELPNGTTSSETHAHAKGVVAFDAPLAATGFWILHSVPHYPPDPASSGGYSYPVTGVTYGQTMLCVSLPTQQADLVGRKLLFSF